jgi:hypothetical protein
MATPLTNYPMSQQPSSVHQAPNNLGNHSQQHIEGYPKLAFFFSQGTRYLHLRSFSALAIRLLLYRQHQLTVLEKNLLELEARDAGSSDPNRQFSLRNFACLYAGPFTSSGQGDQQHELYETLKCELKEYGGEKSKKLCDIH